jgi:hypothetical protein
MFSIIEDLATRGAELIIIVRYSFAPGHNTTRLDQHVLGLQMCEISSSSGRTWDFSYA